MVRTDSCQYNMTSLDVSDGSFGNPVEKAQIWVSNSDLSGFSLRCRKPDALLRTAPTPANPRLDEDKGRQ